MYGFLFQMYMALEALSDGGCKMGLPREMATKLAAHTMMVRIANIRCV